MVLRAREMFAVVLEALMMLLPLRRRECWRCRKSATESSAASRGLCPSLTFEGDAVSAPGRLVRRPSALDLTRVSISSILRRTWLCEILPPSDVGCMRFSIESPLP